ncbi:MAG: hypothetical protein OEY22_01290 [Candidatus Bathyarchaeota archaeon]|nr:hypothetical protein [Candidatus Bathyarchaeota archaeon]
MGNAAWITPFYIAVAWTLMISYQLFTQTAVATVLTYLSMFWPSTSAWLSSRIDMIVFIYAFAWVFVLSSVIPSIILGRERSVLVQFCVCLTLTFVAFMIQDIITNYGAGITDQLLGSTTWFHNPILAVGYLSMPYMLMLMFDIRSRKSQKKTEELEETTATCLENTVVVEQKLEESEEAY